MTNPHVLVLPFPAQGHVNPLMHFSQKLAKNGFKITFVNTEFNHNRVITTATAEQDSLLHSQIKLVSIPDGLGPEDDRNDIAKLCIAMLSTMPAMLEKLIEDTDAWGADNKITCVVADFSMGWAFEVAEKLGIRRVGLWPAAVAVFDMFCGIPKLIDDGIINSDGFATKRQTFQLSQGMPVMDTAHLAWSCIGDTTSQKIIFDYFVRLLQTWTIAEWWLCNTTYQLEPEALAFSPNFLPIGPLMETYHNRGSWGQFWQEDFSCLDWLDQQPPHSVIYVAFGSFTVFDPIQFQELALGLELTGKPFLWVVRPGTDNSVNHPYPDEFTGTRGKIVRWAPQQQVLSHPSLACFITHCGWNSTLEGVCNGVPCLCWPYFADQFFDKTYICDVWKVGFGFDPDERGIISREEIKKKVEQLLSAENLRARSSKLKEMAMNNIAEGGQSSENFKKFIKWLKE